MSAYGRYNRTLAAALGGLVAASWAALLWIGQSPLASVLHAHGVGHHAAAGLPPAAAAALFVVGWLLMCIAMMLPTTFPLAGIFHRLVRRRRDSGRLVTLLLGGYLAAWTGFGLAGVAAQMGLAPAWPASLPGWTAASALFALAGGFQFSPLKYRCLERCRAPLGFVLSRWSGPGTSLQAFRLGLAHGVYCVGCCWALMLLMFAVGSVNLLWMLVLGVVMIAEKNTAAGARLSGSLGIVLLAAALAIAIAGLGGLLPGPAAENL